MPQWGRSPGGGHDNPLQCFCQENLMDRGAWKAPVHRVVKSQTPPKWLNMHTSTSVLRIWVHLQWLKGKYLRTSLVVQWLRHWVSNVGGPGLIPGQGTRSHIPQLKVPSATTEKIAHAATKILHGQINKYIHIYLLIFLIHIFLKGNSPLRPELPIYHVGFSFLSAASRVLAPPLSPSTSVLSLKLSFLSSQAPGGHNLRATFIVTQILLCSWLSAQQNSDLDSHSDRPVQCPLPYAARSLAWLGAAGWRLFHSRVEWYPLGISWAHHTSHFPVLG